MKSLVAEPRRHNRTLLGGAPSQEKPAQAPNGGRTESAFSRMNAVTAPPAKPVEAPGKEKVSLHCFFPKAKKVCVAGSFNGWHTSATPLLDCGGGLWSLELELKPGLHEYRLVVDGDWADDPTANAYVKNPFGTRNGVLAVNSPRPKAKS